MSPQLVEHYDGGIIDVGHRVVLDPADTPELKACVGDTIITTDGRTLLGAVDKAGIAAIMAALEILVFFIPPAITNGEYTYPYAFDDKYGLLYNWTKRTYLSSIISTSLLWGI